MAKIVLRFGEQVLKEYELGAHALKIGRLPDNTVVIDNPAVSSHHARVVHDGGKFVIVVDDDIDITNLGDVIWAVSTQGGRFDGARFWKNGSPSAPLT